MTSVAAASITPKSTIISLKNILVHALFFRLISHHVVWIIVNRIIIQRQSNREERRGKLCYCDVWEAREISSLDYGLAMRRKGERELRVAILVASSTSIDADENRLYQFFKQNQTSRSDSLPRSLARSFAFFVFVRHTDQKARDQIKSIGGQWRSLSKEVWASLNYVCVCESFIESRVLLNKHSMNWWWWAKSWMMMMIPMENKLS